MARLSLWNPTKGNDFNFADRAIGETFKIGGVGILIHMYEGPAIDSDGNTDTNINSIQDVLFQENRSRKYNPDVIELRGHYTPQDVNYDLSQFGIFLSSDTIRIQFHNNDMLDSIGRKLIAGDVLEFPNMRDTPTFDNAAAINKYYVVQDALYAASGYGNKWFPHVWLVRAKAIPSSPEYKEIIDQAAEGQTAGGSGSGTGIMPEGFADTVDGKGNPGLGCDAVIKNSMDLFCKIINISDKIVKEAEVNSLFDPKFYESANLYIFLDPKTNYPVIGSNYFSGNGVPPNAMPGSGALVGAGIQFPPTMQDGEYYLRVDYYPERLFQKQGKIFKLIEVNVLKNWTAYNRLQDSFIDNINDTVLSNGEVISEKQPLSKIVKQKVDLYAERRASTAAKTAAETEAENRAAKRGY